jgi:hypothetical protein
MRLLEYLEGFRPQPPAEPKKKAPKPERPPGGKQFRAEPVDPSQISSGWGEWQEFDIVPGKRSDLEKKLEAHRSLGRKLGLGDVVEWEFSEERMVPITLRDLEQVKKDPSLAMGAGLTRDVWTYYAPRVLLRVRSKPVQIGNWTLIGVLRHGDGATIITKKVDNIEIPKEYRSGTPRCDQCQTSRERTTTFVLLSDKGQWAHVGSTCVKDFLGIESAELLALSSEHQFQSAVGGWDEMEGSPQGGTAGYPIEEVLAAAVTAVRLYGYIKSTEPGSTKMSLDEHFTPKSRSRLPVTADDREKALKLRSWALRLTGETDYESNVRNIFDLFYIRPSNFGLAASVVVAYDRAMALEARKAAGTASKPIGTVGDKIDRVFACQTVFGYENEYGFGKLYTFRDEEGNLAALATSSKSIDIVPQRKYMLAATIKSHGEFKGEAQTKLTRASVLLDLGPTVGEAPPVFAEVRRELERGLAEAEKAKSKAARNRAIDDLYARLRARVAEEGEKGIRAKAEQRRNDVLERLLCATTKAKKFWSYLFTDVLVELQKGNLDAAEESMRVADEELKKIFELEEAYDEAQKEQLPGTTQLDRAARLAPQYTEEEIASCDEALANTKLSYEAARDFRDRAKEREGLARSRVARARERAAAGGPSAERHEREAKAWQWYADMIVIGVSDLAARGWPMRFQHLNVKWSEPV